MCAYRVKREKNSSKLHKLGFRWLFHITHVDNLASIASNGLKSHREAKQFHPVDISDSNVNKRRKRPAPISGRSIHEYVPLYFRARNPMLYLRKARQKDLAILYIDRTVADYSGVLFTDGNAASLPTEFYDDFNKLNQLDLKVLRADYWNDYEDGKRKRCAEVLVPDAIPFESVSRVVVENASADQRAAAAFAQSSNRPEQWVKPDWFFQ